MTKKALINYTSKSFDTIKQDLVDHAKRYYPDRYEDFNGSSFGSIMLDAVAYVGDIMSFYLDYQVNESFVETALETQNLLNLIEQMGYKSLGLPSTYGRVTLFCLVPANDSGLGPNTAYIPIIKKGAKFSSSKRNTFTLVENIDFNKSNVEVVAARFDNTSGKPTFYAMRSYGSVKSGDNYSKSVTVGASEKFLRVRIGPNIINEVDNVVDSDGNIYYEVDYLSQDTVYLETTNDNYANDGVRSIIKPFSAARRFVVEQDDNGTFLRFGYGSDETTNNVDVSDPKSIVMQMSGKNYFTDSAFDPNKLLNTNKFGIAPANTTLKIDFITNLTNNANESAGSIKNVDLVIIDFQDPDLILPNINQAILESIEVSNEESFVVSSPAFTNEELKYQTFASYATQNRIVTKNDYEAYCYRMPPKFGSILRASIINDPSNTNKRLSLYIMSKKDSGILLPANDTIKNNLKVWLQKNKPLSDSINIYSAVIINIGFDYQIVVDNSYDKDLVLDIAQAKIREMFSEHFYIGEPLYITRIYNALNKINGVIDTVKVTAKVRTGGNYTNTDLDIMDLLSKDGTYINTPKNCILEILFPARDIRGSAV